MKRRPALLTAAATALAVTAAAHPAVASPPSGLFGFEEYGQARVVSPASLEFPVGKEVALGNYALAAGADSGWRRTVGESVFAVTAGTLSVESGADCRTTAYRAGEATVLPAGVYRITDAGNDAVAMAVAFLNLPTGGAKPFADGPPQPAPRGCASPAGAEQSGVSVGRYARATMSPPDTYGTSEHSGHSGQVDVTAGSDVVGSIYTLEPGFASGWFQHGPALNLITKGVLTYYEAHDGHCVEAGKWSAGQAFVHNHRHTHMAVNEGTEEVIDVAFNFDLPHGDPKPGVGRELDVFDFTPFPPAGCPRLR